MQVMLLLPDLELEDGDEGNRLAIVSGLADFLGNQKKLLLVFLNGCSTQNLARNLSDKGIPAVIYTNESINDEVARQFAIYFYQAIERGRTISDAFTEAAAGIQTDARFASTAAMYQARASRLINPPDTNSSLGNIYTPRLCQPAKNMATKGNAKSSNTSTGI